MATTFDYLNYTLSLLNDTLNISYRKMMGEYLLYSNGQLFGGIYDNRILIKKTPSNEVEDLREELPYQGAKVMYLIDSEDKNYIERLIRNVIKDLF